MKTLGIIGGMGPRATARFYELVTVMNSARSDQEHFDVIIVSYPSIPDRTKFLLGESGEDPVPKINEAGAMLERCKADYIAIPCFTSHCYADRFSFGVPLISIVDETIEELKRRGIERFGLMATEGTVKTGLFARAAGASDLEIITPGTDAQRTVTDIIYNRIKRNLPPDTDAFEGVAASLRQRGAQAIVLGCTELSLVPMRDGENGFLDPLKILAQRAIALCGGQE